MSDDYAANVAIVSRHARFTIKRSFVRGYQARSRGKGGYLIVAGAAGRVSRFSPGLCIDPGLPASSPDGCFARPRSLSSDFNRSDADFGPIPSNIFMESDEKPAASGA